MCADTSSKLYEDTSLKLYEDVSPNLYEDTSSGIYSTVNEATKKTSSQYAIQAMETTAVQKELKIEVSNGPGWKEKKANKTRKTSLNKSLDIEVVKQKTEKRRKNRITSQCHVKFAFAIVFIFAMIGVVAMVMTLFLQMRNLHEMNRALQKSVERLNHEKNKISEQTKLSHLYDFVLSMDNKIKYFNISLDKSQKLVNDLISAQENINREVLKRFSSISHLFSSCSDIAKLNSFYASGNYIVKSFAGVLRSVYCDMSRTFSGTSAGWMRVAELDVNNCPPGLRHQITKSVSNCVVMEGNPGCTEIIYPVYNTQYTQIVGQIRGYQIKSSDGFVSVRVPRPTNFTNLNSNYLDGVSISTNGQHVWSFAAGCNCLNTKNKPTVIGQDYTCDGVQARHFEYDGLLWASQQCGRNSTWFYKVLSPTTTDIKVRICRDQFRSDEDLAINTLILYIQ